MAKPKRDYYEILGVSKTATKPEIKKAYRKLAMQHHPDRNKGHDAEEKFKEVQEAYEILSHDETRQKYDQFGHAAFDQASGGYGFRDFNFGGFNGFEDIFSSFFGGGRPRGPRKGEDYQAQIAVSFKESLKGKVIKQKLDKYQDGKRTQKETEIKIPPGIRNGQSIAIRGFGGPGHQGGPSGDLYVQIRVKDHKYFVRQGNDIHIEVPISAFAILTEQEITIPTPWKKVPYKLKSTLTSGSTFKIVGEGAPSLSTNIKGNLVVHVKIYVPQLHGKELEEAKKALKSIRDKVPHKFLREFDV